MGKNPYHRFEWSKFSSETSASSCENGDIIDMSANLINSTKPADILHG